ncbi:MAG: efflux transporter outer membrane subunit [Opitutus sp.]|nr:efflux transporter outer membrane subunit [Opitutus sp.]
MKSLLLFSLSASLAFAGLPSVGPDYHRPDVTSPDAYRDAEYAGPWKVATPSDELARGEWWRLFSDPVLDELQRRALAGNLDLQAAAARVEQAAAAAGIARSAYWPQIAADPSLVREQTSRTTDNTLPNARTTTYRAPLVASWELDLFGRVRRLSESVRAEADAAFAVFESLRLALTSEVAANYFSLRAADREREIVEQNIVLRRRALELVQSRRTSGTGSDLDVARAEAELASTQAELSAVSRQHEALHNALAVLTGEAASTFVLPAREAIPAIPRVPVGLPSDLLERRPDVAAAERALMAANARIGVAKAAFFPAISLTGSAGYASGDIDSLFRSDSRAWSIGPSLYLPIFQGGRNRANLARSRAAYEESVAQFRQRVLVAFREVQDALTAARLLDDERAAQERASTSARRAVQLATRRYDAGYVSFLEVLDAQRTALAAERATAQLEAQRLNASVALLKALGGGWHAEHLGQAVARN